MDSLNYKIEQAAEQFRTYHFTQAFQLYNECIQLCQQFDGPQNMLHNLMSTKGALQNILGNVEDALTTLNQVLEANPYHTLALVRRSQIFKKKNNFKKAMKDLKIVSYYSPDNLQIAALRLEIDNLIGKQHNHSDAISSSEESDQQECLNFANLKKIDRKSVSIMFTPEKRRKSRVTISGDTAIQYDQQEYCKLDFSPNSTALSQEEVKEKLQYTLKQIEDDSKMQQEHPETNQIPKLLVKGNERNKSILKNRSSQIYHNDKVKSIVVNEQDDNKMLAKLKNIEGRVIVTQGGRQNGQVQFRKSAFVNSNKVNNFSNAPNKKSLNRKSCLKRSSFNIQSINNSQPRRSKFEMLGKIQIDGHVLKSKNKSIDTVQEYNNNDNSVKSDSSDQGSSHNIFGKQPIVFTPEMQTKLGLKNQKSQENKQKSSNCPNRGKSILKKNSLLYKLADKNSKQLSEKKPKKSVMFY